MPVPRLQELLLVCKSFSCPTLIECLNSRKGDVLPGYSTLERVSVTLCANLGAGEKVELHACAASSFDLHLMLQARLHH